MLMSTYDMATIRERFAHTQEGFLSEIFRVKSGERYEWSVFTIHMLEPLSSERFLSCVFQIYRDMGEMSGIVFPDVRNEHGREMIALHVSARMKRESSLWRRDERCTCLLERSEPSFPWC